MLPVDSPSTRRPTIKDVAATAGVSTATVSRVLSGLGGASASIQLRINQCAEALGYRPNRRARGLRVRQGNLVGLIVPDLLNPFFTSMAHGVEEFLSDAGYTLLLGHSGDSHLREKRHLEVFLDEGADGIVFVPSNEIGYAYEELAQLKIPIIAVDRAPRGLICDFVSTDNRASANLAAAHLIERGYRQIAFINGPPELDVSGHRLSGVLDAFRIAGLPAKSLMVETGDFRQGGGARAMELLLKKHQRPEAVIVGNNLMTLGALEVANLLGLRIPQDVALVCFDDMPWATSLNPPLTAIAQPAEEVGRTAARLLLERLTRPHRATQSVVLTSRLIVRASCGSHTARTGAS